MLINDLEYFKGSANYTHQTNGIDNPKYSHRDTKGWHAYTVQNFDYKYNSWGFRGPDYDQYVGKPVNICLGDSFTVNVGGPIEYSWCSQLAKHFNIPTLNLGMDGAGNDAIRLVYERACKLFDVQNTFVMYSFFHRRLIDNTFQQHLYDDNENFAFFLEQRIPNAIECALPVWTWTANEEQFLHTMNIYFYDISLYIYDNQEIDRTYINPLQQELYKKFKGPDWPTLEQFVKGADPHPDMFTKQFGQFLHYTKYTNRDGCHMNQETNKVYADYLYNQWKLKNES